MRRCLLIGYSKWANLRAARCFSAEQLYLLLSMLPLIIDIYQESWFWPIHVLNHQFVCLLRVFCYPPRYLLCVCVSSSMGFFSSFFFVIKMVKYSLVNMSFYMSQCYFFCVLPHLCKLDFFLKSRFRFFCNPRFFDFQKIKWNVPRGFWLRLFCGI